MFRNLIPSQKRNRPVQETAVGLLAGGAALGLVAALWTRLKGFAWRVVGLLVGRVEVPAEAAQAAAKNAFCIHHAPKLADGAGESGGSSDGLAWYQQGSYRLLAHTPDQLGKARTNNGKALDNLISPQRVKDLIREVELWR